MQKYYQDEPRFNGAYSITNLPELRDRDYVINFDEYKSIGTHWVALHVNGENVTYFDSFGVEHTLIELKEIIGNENITANIFRTQAYNSVIC